MGLGEYKYFGSNVNRSLLTIVDMNGIAVSAVVFVGLLARLVNLSIVLILSRQARALVLPLHQQRPAGEQLLQTQQHVAPRQPQCKSRIVQAFSLIGASGSLDKLVDLPAYIPTVCLNGLRVLSMGWIILGHTFFMPEVISGYAND